VYLMSCLVPRYLVLTLSLTSNLLAQVTRSSRHSFPLSKQAIRKTHPPFRSRPVHTNSQSIHPSTTAIPKMLHHIPLSILLLSTLTIAQTTCPSVPSQATTTIYQCISSPSMANTHSTTTVIPTIIIPVAVTTAMSSKTTTTSTNATSIGSTGIGAKVSTAIGSSSKVSGTAAASSTFKAGAGVVSVPVGGSIMGLAGVAVAVLLFL